MQKDTQNKQQTKSCKADFQICRLLGKGSYGSVYKVIRKSDQQQYAMKEVSLGLESEGARGGSQRDSNVSRSPP